MKSKADLKSMKLKYKFRDYYKITISDNKFWRVLVSLEISGKFESTKRVIQIGWVKIKAEMRIFVSND